MEPKKPHEEEYKYLLNHAIKNLTNGEDIAKYVKAQRLSWFDDIKKKKKKKML